MFWWKFVRCIKSKIISNQQLAEELQKTTIRKLDKQKLYLSFKESIWDAHLADSNSEVNIIKEFHFYYDYIYSKYKWVVTIKLLQLLTHFKKFWMRACFYSNQWNHGRKIKNKLKLIINQIKYSRWYWNLFNTFWRKICCCWKNLE